MKKALAAVGATTLGAGAAVLPAVPAAAEPVTEECVNFDEHTLPVEELPDNWYMDCVPQYGLGKAAFTIWADDAAPGTEEFPAEFVPLTDPEVTATTTLNPGLTAYVPEEPAAGAFAELLNINQDAVSQTYIGLVMAPITSVAPLEGALTDDMAEQCGPEVFTQPGELSGYLATFGPFNTTFDQPALDESWNYTITGTPAPTAFIFVPGEGGGIQPDSLFCVTDGIGAFSGVAGAEGEQEDFAFLSVLPYPEAIDAGLDDFRFIGDFYRKIPVPPVDPVTPAAPTLPATGADAAPTGLAAAALGVLGAALLALGVRRRSSRAE